MKKLLALILFGGTVSSATSQQLYSAVLSDQVPSYILGVWKSTPLPDGSLLMNGSMGTGVGFLLHYNHNIPVIWYKTYSGFRDILYARPAPDGSVFAAGITTNYNLAFMKADNTGNPVWTTVRAGTTVYMNGFIIPKANGGCLAGGGALGTDSLFICEIDNSGNVLWAKSYEVFLSVYQNDFAQPTPDNGLIICSTLGSAGGACLLKLDSLGNIEWQKAYPGTGHGYCARAMGNGYFFTAQGNEHIACQTDSAGNVIWSRVWPINSNGNITEKPFPLITQGNSRTVSGTRFVGNFTKAVLFSFDGAGSLLWSRTYTYSPSDNDADVVSAFRYPDNAIGFTKIVPNGNLVWSVNTDSTGNLSCATEPPIIAPVPGAYSAGPSAIVAHPIIYTWNTMVNTANSRLLGYNLLCNPLAVAGGEENAPVKIYPSPAASAVHFSFPAVADQTVEIFNPAGERIFFQKTGNEPDFELNTASWPNGIYFWRLNGNDGWRLAGHFAVVH